MTRSLSSSWELIAAPHTLAAEEVAARLGVPSGFGLTGEEAKRRSVQHGPNRLLAAFVGSVKDAVVILAVVVISNLRAPSGKPCGAGKIAAE